MQVVWVGAGAADVEDGLDGGGGAGAGDALDAAVVVPDEALLAGAVGALKVLQRLEAAALLAPARRRSERAQAWCSSLADAEENFHHQDPGTDP